MTTNIPKVIKILERKSKNFYVKCENSEPKWVSFYLLNKHYKPMLEEFTLAQHNNKKAKNNKEINIENPKVTEPLINLEEEIREQNLIEEENFNKFYSENEEKMRNNHREFDVPEKFLCQKTLRKKIYKIEYKTAKGVEIRKVSFNFLKQNYPIKLLNFIQKNNFKEGVVITTGGDIMKSLNKLLTDKNNS
jgi:hypothetical protein